MPRRDCVSHLRRLAQLPRDRTPDEIDRLGEQRRDAGPEAHARAAAGDGQVLEADAERPLLPAGVALLLDERLDERLEAEGVVVRIGLGREVIGVERAGAGQTPDEIAHGLGVEVLSA